MFTLAKYGDDQIIQVEEKEYKMMPKFDHRLFHVILQLVTVMNLCWVVYPYIARRLVYVSTIVSNTHVEYQ